MQKNVFLMPMDSASHFAKRKWKSAHSVLSIKEKKINYMSVKKTIITFTVSFCHNLIDEYLTKAHISPMNETENEPAYQHIYYLAQ